MKKIFLYTTLSLGAYSSFAQYQPVEYYNVSTQSARATRLNNPEGKTTMIDGRKISGVPFLYDQWLPATITLKDGNVYDSYKVKYDIYHQTVFFLNGNDSMEVADPIKEFVIESPVRKMSFIDAGIYKKQKKAMYFEILANEAKGQLLKGYKKVIETESGSSLVDDANAKYFKSASEFYYYNTATDKLISIGNTASAIRSSLKLSKEQEDALSFSTFDFSNDTDIISFMKSYLQLK